MSEQQTAAGIKRGRPRAPVPGVAVGTWLRATEYDRLLRLAAAREESVSAIVRRIVVRRLTRRR
jgi:hypothetical protein